MELGTLELKEFFAYSLKQCKEGVIMGWLTREPPKVTGESEKKAIPSGIWEKCPRCSEIMLVSDLEENQRVCLHCSYHYRLTANERLDQLTDSNTFEEWDPNLVSEDPLVFNDGRSYSKRLLSQFEKSGRTDAIVTGGAQLGGVNIGIGVFDFFWMGGSMGAVVGERLVRLFHRSRKLQLPVVIVSSSGGARMHEGLVSLMQMARTCAVVHQHREASLPFLSILADPTTGGVAASFATLGDFNISEPGATIGFAGRRVIESTIRQKLPDDFQTSEFCLEHGLLDLVVRRSDLKKTLANILDILLIKKRS